MSSFIVRVLDKIGEEMTDEAFFVIEFSYVLLNIILFISYKYTRKTAEKSKVFVKIYLLVDRIHIMRSYM